MIIKILTFIKNKINQMIEDKHININILIIETI